MRWTLIAFAVSLLTMIAPAPRASAQSVDVTGPRFDWFEYKGNDPVYRDVAATSNEYLNPILAGFYPDPSIVRVENDFYLVTSSFAYYPGIPVFHSEDLVHWTQLGHVLDRPSQLPLDGLGISRGVFAPTIRHHDGTFYVVSTLVDAGGNFVVTADNPAGPWSGPTFLPFDGIDPSLFFDDDGRAYVTNNGPPDYEPLYEGHRALWIQEFDPDTLTPVGPRRVIVDGGVDLSEEPIWIEGPHLFKRDGTYYLIAAEGGTGANHSEVVFRSDDVFGPYEPYDGNPILTQRHLAPDRSRPVSSSGHADFVQLPNGDWWAVFLGTRPYTGDHYNTGRETFLLPVEWTEAGWPHIVGGTEPIPFVHQRPDLPRQPAPDVPTAGNFTFRDDFAGDALRPYWTHIRTPDTTLHDVRGGSLTLTARDAALGDVNAQPAFVGRRQQHAHAAASTTMRYVPQHEGDRAGLAAFQNADYYFLLAAAQVDGRTVVQVERAAGGAPEVIARAPLQRLDSAPLYLKIEARGGEYDFFYAEAEDAWRPLLRGADGTILSTSTAGGFVGTMLGLYAYSDY